MKDEKKAGGILEAFSELTDPRWRACEHPLEELLLVAICGITGSAESWVEVALWGNERLDWLRRYLPFANGIADIPHKIRII